MNDNFSVLDPQVCRAVPGYAAMSLPDRAALCEYALGQVHKRQGLGDFGIPETITLVIIIVAAVIASGVGLAAGIVKAVQTKRVNREVAETNRLIDQTNEINAVTAQIDTDTKTKENTAKVVVIGIGIFAAAAIVLAIKK